MRVVYINANMSGIPRSVTAGSLALLFGAMVRERQPEKLETWLHDAEASGIAEFSNFAKGLRKDDKAVRAGLTLEWSNGPVEGHINRLKLIKRTMYGRAGMDLLKKRYLYAA
jgi:transposase